MPEFLVFDEQALPGTYTIYAENITTGCAIDMMGSIVPHPLPQAYNILPNGILCEGTEVTLQASEPGIHYQPWFNEAPYGDIINGDPAGGPISFGMINQPGGVPCISH